MTELVIGIDIGGTITKLGFVDQRGNVHAEGSVRTSTYNNAPDFVNSLGQQLKKLQKTIQFPISVVGVGIGAPDANFHNGTVEYPTNLDWKGVTPLADLFRSIYDLPVMVTNDANAAALGEMKFGNARKMKDFIMITLGTGLGSGIVVNGNLTYGHDGFAGELGHINIKKNGRKCGCGNFGCLETYASSPGIIRTVFEILASDHQNSELAEYSFNQLDSETIFRAAERNDPVALKAFDITGMILGSSLADAVAMTSPEAIFLFGGLAKAGKYIFEPTKKYMEESLMPTFRNKVRLEPSGLMDQNAAILGASALIWNTVQT